MKRSLWMAVLVLGVAFVLLPGGAPPTSGAGVKVLWLTPAKGEALAKKTGKPILYDFTAEWCGWCKVLDREVFSNPKHARRIATAFVAVKVLDRRREEGRNAPEVDALLRKFQVRGFPTLGVKRADGTLDVLPGFAGEDGTVRFLERNGMK